MRSEHLLDPGVRALVAMLPKVAVSAETLPQMREPNRFPLAPATNLDRVDKSEAMAPGRDGAPGVPLIVYRPIDKAGEALPCIYHVHGGGYIAGRAAMMEPIHYAMAEQLGCAIVSVDYRLAPEVPHPGPLEDCYAGLAWLFAQAEGLKIDTGRIGVMGESAGGGLAAALALLARDRGEYALAFQHLIYPMLDDRTCTADEHPFAGDYIWTHSDNRFGWRSYLGMEPGAAEVTAYAAPARCEDLRGLPPTFLMTGALDLFVEEDLEYARRLIRAGVPTELHVYPGAVHAFDIAPVELGQRATRESRDALARFLKG